MPSDAPAAQTRKAKNRLTEMTVQEVSFVDNGANLRRFCVTKRADDMTTDVNKDASEIAKAMKLPSAAKQAMMDALAQSLDKLTGIAQAVGESEVDEAAPVPPELGGALKACGEILSGLGDQYGGAAAPPQGQQPPPAQPPPAQPPPARPPPPRPPVPGAKDADGASAPAGSPAAAPPAPATADGQAAAAAESTPATSDADERLAALRVLTAALTKDLEGEVSKAGRKIAGARFARLKSHFEGLGKLIGELEHKAQGDEEEEDDTTAPPAGAPPAFKATEGDASASPSLATDAAAAIKAAITDAIAPIVQTVKEQGEALAKLMPVSKAAGPSNAQTVEGAGASPTRVIWPADMSADIERRKGR